MFNHCYIFTSNIYYTLNGYGYQLLYSITKLSKYNSIYGKNIKEYQIYFIADCTYIYILIFNNCDYASKTITYILIEVYRYTSMFVKKDNLCKYSKTQYFYNVFKNIIICTQLFQNIFVILQQVRTYTY